MSTPEHCGTHCRRRDSRFMGSRPLIWRIRVRRFNELPGHPKRGRRYVGLPSSNTTSSQSLSEGVDQNRPFSLRAYLDLTKPRLLPMVLFTGLPVLAFAASGWPSPTLGFLTLLGVALAAASANALNAYVERDLDAVMERTRERPLPAGKISPRSALFFGVALGVVARFYSAPSEAGWPPVCAWRVFSSTSSSIRFGSSLEPRGTPYSVRQRVPPLLF